MNLWWISRSVVAGHSRPKDGVASPAYVPATHVLLVVEKTSGAVSIGWPMSALPLEADIRRRRFDVR
jgi:hypothetical protein